MSLYDDYFTNDDKPFAENFNDALLLSNVFDLTVPIELPRMFNNGEWSTGTGQRKAGVSIIQTEGIDNNKIEIRNNSLIANDDATVLITVYPNFNQYGNLQKVYWEFEDGAGTDLTVDVLTEQRTSLLTNIPNNSVLSSVPYLQQLHKFILRLNFEGGTGIKKLGFIMQNKQQDRYGAEVGISDVNGLEDDLNSLESSLDGLDSAITTGLSGKVDKVTGKQLSTNDFTSALKTRLESIQIQSQDLFSQPQFSPQFKVAELTEVKLGNLVLVHLTVPESIALSTTQLEMLCPSKCLGNGLTIVAFNKEAEDYYISIQIEAQTGSRSLLKLASFPATTYTGRYLVGIGRL